MPCRNRTKLSAFRNTGWFQACLPERRKVAVKVVDIYGNDTMTIVEVNVGGRL
jgi:hypothetical protein